MYICQYSTFNTNQPLTKETPIKTRGQERKVNQTIKSRSDGITYFQSYFKLCDTSFVDNKGNMKLSAQIKGRRRKTLV